ncbi:MAG: hypothetical protein C4518_20300 [Desulfobacteraceae bacterium]|nr:MAG: hypothetical protein C4518_20300 [Desulfobacteraceae bacterium]
MTETLPPDAPDAAMIDEAVQYINERVAAHVYRGSLEIGEYVLERFFGNDIQLAGSKSRYKPVSYRKLCDHPDLAVSRFTLMNMVKTAVQVQFLISGGIPVDRLNYSQQVFLARLENNEEKLALARECIDAGILAEDLKARVREICDQSGSLSPVAAVRKYLDRINRWMLRMSVPEGMTDRTVIAGADPAEREKILDAAGGILEDMSVITNRIRDLVTTLTETPAEPEIPPLPEEPA